MVSDALLEVMVKLVLEGRRVPSHRQHVAMVRDEVLSELAEVHDPRKVAASLSGEAESALRLFYGVHRTPRVEQEWAEVLGSAILLPGLTSLV